jgi:hypothetical protein
MSHDVPPLATPPSKNPSPLCERSHDVAPQCARILIANGVVPAPPFVIGSEY